MLRQSRFISVEVVIKTDHDCDAFVQWFQSQDNHVEKMPCGTHRWHVYFAPLPSSSADSTIQILTTMILELPENIKIQWDQAGIREFIIGYHVGDEPISYQDHFIPETLAMAAQVGAGIGITLYPSSMGADDPQPNEEDVEQGMAGQPAFSS